MKARYNRRKLCTTFGVELTYHAPFIISDSFLSDYEHSCASDFIRSKCCEKKLPFFHISTDGGRESFEIATPILRSWRHAENWYKKWDSILQKTPYRATDDYFWKPGKVWEGSGGGHIHCGIPKGIDTWLLAINLGRFIISRPWLNWVFNESCDVYNANSLYSIRNVARADFLEDSHYKYCLLNDSFYIHSDWNPPLSKSFAINFYKSQYELRFFDAPKDWKQFEEHLDFANNLVRYVQTETRAKRLLPKADSRTLTGWKRKRTRNHSLIESVRIEFKETCSILGVDWIVYEKYLKNMKLRQTEGYTLC